MPTPERVLNRLRIVRWVGVVDTVLLIWLLYVSQVTHDRDMVRILGSIHGLGFLLLAGLSAIWASEKYWSWWFPAAIVATGGPIGALLGDWMISRRARAG